MGTETTIDLSPFMEGGHSCKAWTADGWRHASNGHLAVRVKTDEPDSGEAPKLMMERVFDFPPDAPQTPWPIGGFHVGMGECPNEECDGGYVGRAECEFCRGTGECRCSCGDEHDCCECDGTGKTKGGTKCPVCKGEGEFEQDLWQPVYNRVVKARYAKLLLTLPNLKYVEDGSSGKQPIKFTFDGGNGVVMPYLPNG